MIKKTSKIEENPLVKQTVMNAVYRQDIVALKQLLAQGSPVNEPDFLGRTPAGQAARLGHFEALHLLLNAGANIHTKDVDGWVPSMYAACWGRADCLALLIAAGADVSVQGVGGSTALSLAQARGDRECVEMIEAALEVQQLKAEVNSVSPSPTTPPALRL